MVDECFACPTAFFGAVVRQYERPYCGERAWPSSDSVNGTQWCLVPSDDHRVHASTLPVVREVGDSILRPHAMRVTTAYNGAFALVNSFAPYPLPYRSTLARNPLGAARKRKEDLVDVCLGRV